MPKALVNGVNINYEEQGSGFPMVWMHGLHGSLRNWDAQVAFFCDKYRVIAFDSRGLGQSDAPPEPEKYSQDILVEDLHQLLLKLGIERAYIGGLSMGGNVALNFAIKHPEMTRSFISADTGTGANNKEEFKKRMDEQASRFEKEGMAAMKDQVLLGGAWATLYRTQPQIYQAIEKDFLTNSPIGVANLMRGVQGARPTIYALEPQLKALQVPGLIIVGELDENCIAPSDFMKENIPNSRLVVIADAGHNTHVEKPDEFNEAVTDFLRWVESRGE